MHPPVVEHLGYMHRRRSGVSGCISSIMRRNRSWSWAPSHSGALAPHRLEQFPAEHRQMADIIAGHQVFGGIVGLEVGHVGVLGRVAEKRLVTVKELRHRPAAFCLPDARPMCRWHGGQLVVMVGQGKIRPVGQLRRRLVLAAMPALSILTYLMRGSAAARRRTASPPRRGRSRRRRPGRAATARRSGPARCPETIQVFGRRVVKRRQNADEGNAAVSWARWAASAFLPGR